MLLKPQAGVMVAQQGYTCFSTLYRVDAIEASDDDGDGVYETVCFSTLYRVDAIEARARARRLWRLVAFQYPLSGRCY